MLKYLFISLAIIVIVIIIISVYLYLYSYSTSNNEDDGDNKNIGDIGKDPNIPKPVKLSFIFRDSLPTKLLVYKNQELIYKDDPYSNGDFATYEKDISEFIDSENDVGSKLRVVLEDIPNDDWDASFNIYNQELKLQFGNKIKTFNFNEVRTNEIDSGLGRKEATYAVAEFEIPHKN